MTVRERKLLPVMRRSGGGGGMRKKRFKNRISPDSIRAFYQRQIADSVVK